MLKKRGAVVARTEDALVTIGLVDRGEDIQPAAAFSFGSTLWLTRLIEGEFPNWRQIVPDEGAGAAVEFEIEEMGSALKAVEAVANGNGTPVRLSLGDTTTLALVEGDATAIRETLASAVFSPDGVGEVQVAFNVRYLADGLKFVGTERARMRVRGRVRVRTAHLVPALRGDPRRERGARSGHLAGMGGGMVTATNLRLFATLQDGSGSLAQIYCDGHQRFVFERTDRNAMVVERLVSNPHRSSRTCARCHLTFTGSRCCRRRPRVSPHASSCFRRQQCWLEARVSSGGSRSKS